MLVARKKAKWVLFVPTYLIALLAMTLLVNIPGAHISAGTRQFFWIVRFALVGGLAFSTRFARRRSASAVVWDLLGRRTLAVTADMRIVAKYESNIHTARPQPNYAFRIAGPDDTVAELGKAWWTSGTTPADMGRRLSAVLDIPLADDTPGAGSERSVSPIIKVATKTERKGLEDRITGWLRLHWLLSIGGGLAPFLAYFHFAGGMETRAHAQIDMPCAGHGYHARLRFGAFTRLDGNVSGDINPGASEVAVWDESRRCWARRIMSVDLGQRLRVDCVWVLASTDCLTDRPQ